jgi:hypothetical protein
MDYRVGYTAFLINACNVLRAQETSKETLANVPALRW